MDQSAGKPADDAVEQLFFEICMAQKKDVQKPKLVTADYAEWSSRFLELIKLYLRTKLLDEEFCKKIVPQIRRLHKETRLVDVLTLRILCDEILKEYGLDNCMPHWLEPGTFCSVRHALMKMGLRRESLYQAVLEKTWCPICAKCMFDTSWNLSLLKQHLIVTYGVCSWSCLEIAAIKGNVGTVVQSGIKILF